MLTTIPRSSRTEEAVIPHIQEWAACSGLEVGSAG